MFSGCCYDRGCLSQTGRHNVQAGVLGTMSPTAEEPQETGHLRQAPPNPQSVPMTVRWVLAVMLVTTLVATHSHSPWSSLLRARNCRLPLGRALCLLLLGFPTLAKHGGGSGRPGQKRSHRLSGLQKGDSTGLQPIALRCPLGTEQSHPCPHGAPQSPPLPRVTLAVAPWEQSGPSQTPTALLQPRGPGVPFYR